MSRDSILRYVVWSQVYDAKAAVTLARACRLQAPGPVRFSEPASV